MPTAHVMKAGATIGSCKGQRQYPNDGGPQMVCPGCKEGSFVTRRSAILCVDDEPNILALRSALLGMAGYKVHIAKDGRSGLEIFRNQPVDLVVLDYDM